MIKSKEIAKINEDISITKKYLRNCYDLLEFMKMIAYRKKTEAIELDKFHAVNTHFELLDLNLSYFEFLLKSTIFEKVKLLAKRYYERDLIGLEVLENEFRKEFQRLNRNWKVARLN